MGATAEDISISARRGQRSPIRVMVVDDSAVIRGIFRRTLEQDPDIIVTASVGDGSRAVAALEREKVDVIVLDIEMPVMDGMTALTRLLEIDPDVRIIMASTLTQANAEISLQAMAKGAADYIPKPVAKHEIHSADGFKRELVEKIKALAPLSRFSTPSESAKLRLEATAAPAPAPRAIVLRKPSTVAPRIMAIGSSTGGPQALFKLFEGLRGGFRHLPVVITQHMPKSFTGILAQHLAKVAGVPCIEGMDGGIVEPGHIYIAPGDEHMEIHRSGPNCVARLTKNPPVNFCRPSVEPMFGTVFDAFGPATLALMLTGMGHDGRDASGRIADGGGTLIAQDEATSVVWGMPGAVASAGYCAAVLPLDEIAPHVLRLVGRKS